MLFFTAAAAGCQSSAELEAFAVNTLEYIRREAKLTFEPLVLPPLRCDFRGRHALVVSTLANRLRIPASHPHTAPTLAVTGGPSLVCSVLLGDSREARWSRRLDINFGLPRGLISRAASPTFRVRRAPRPSGIPRRAGGQALRARGRSGSASTASNVSSSTPTR